MLCSFSYVPLNVTNHLSSCYHVRQEALSSDGYGVTERRGTGGIFSQFRETVPPFAYWTDWDR